MSRDCEQERLRRLKRAARRGFADGVASAFAILGTGRPAPPFVRRGLGSLIEDADALRRDCERLLHGNA